MKTSHTSTKDLLSQRLKADIARLDAAKTAIQPLQPIGAWGKAVHRFDSQQIYAIIAALAAGRPLLVRGDPGLGKSQLARAVAALLGRRFIPAIVQPDTEYSDLLWSVDYTQRLADAQLAAHTGDATGIQNMQNYVGTGPIWWAYAWAQAEAQHARCGHNYCPPDDESIPNPEVSGSVLLIDEVDKADISLANGLLEVLGNGAFAIPLLETTVKPQGRPPLVVLTSNDIRELPAALVRRCVVLELTLPDALQEYLLLIGQTHFPTMDEGVMLKAAEQIIEDRSVCREPPKTGLAEYLDLLQALSQVGGEAKEQLEWLENLASYFFKSAAVPR